MTVWQPFLGVGSHGPYVFFRFLIAIDHQPLWGYEGCLN